MKYWRILTLILLILLFAGCKERIREEKGSPEKSEIKRRFELNENSLRISEIKIERVERRKFSELIRANGEVTFNPKSMASITTLFSGIVREVFVFEGDRVRKGEKMAGIFSKEFLSAQSDFLLILKRYKRAVEKGNEEDIAQSLQMLNSAKQKLRIFGLEDEDINELSEKGEVNPTLYLKSPLNGKVIESNAFLGGSFSEGTTLFKIAEVENLWVNVNLYEKDFKKIELGSPATLKLSSMPEREFKGIFKSIGDVLSKETRTVKGRVEIRDQTGILKPGMLVEVYIKGNKSEEVLSIPESAVRKIEGKDFVFVSVGRNSFELREVELGRSFDGFREVLNGLREGELIVSEGSFLLKSHALKEMMEVD
jgi:multidrug efflux pump subunit AcrA (membrane-fusion protein)